MACYHPLTAYRGRRNTSPIVFNYAESNGVKLELPCGQCIGCRLERSRQWAVRMMHEAQLHEENCFITLTYDSEHLPSDGNLRLDHFQDFMKRLRARISPIKVRFFHCGEYGDNFGRPHYHAILFGFDFPDRKMYSESHGVRLYSSELLADLWPCGFSSVGNVTFESCAYVARYVVKKVTGHLADSHYMRLLDSGELVPVIPEYTTMSRRPGIASRWFQKFGNEVFPTDEVIARGFSSKPPRFYDKLFVEAHGESAFEPTRRRRERSARQRASNATPARLAVREVCHKAKVKLLRRGLESEIGP